MKPTGDCHLCSIDAVGKYVSISNSMCFCDEMQVFVLHNSAENMRNIRKETWNKSFACFFCVNSIRIFLKTLNHPVVNYCFISSTQCAYQPKHTCIWMNDQRRTSSFAYGRGKQRRINNGEICNHWLSTPSERQKIGWRNCKRKRMS